MNLKKLKTLQRGSCLLVQWLGFSPFTAGAWVQSLVLELRSLKPCDSKKFKTNHHSPPSFQVLRLQTRITLFYRHKTTQFPLKDLLKPSASHHPTTTPLLRITVTSCQYSRRASELSSHSPGTCSALLPLEFCFLPLDILSFHRSGLKVTSSVMS